MAAGIWWRSEAIGAIAAFCAFAAAGIGLLTASHAGDARAGLRAIRAGNYRVHWRYPDFIWNSTRSLDLLRPATARLVTDNCPMQQIMLPLYIEGDHFTTPFCCYGNDVDCDRCGAWAVFHLAARRERGRHAARPAPA